MFLRTNGLYRHLEYNCSRYPIFLPSLIHLSQSLLLLPYPQYLLQIPHHCLNISIHLFNINSTITCCNHNKYDRNKFEKNEIDIIWEQKEDKYYQIVLMLLYSGVRISEMLDLKKENVHLDEQYFDVICSKTENGIRRLSKRLWDTLVL